MAALASIPRREHFLPAVLRSLRGQVDRLCVYLNGYGAVPASVLELADEHVLSPTNGGAERKLHWAAEWDGIYLSCDDDFGYVDGYVATMISAVERWRSAAFITAHGRAYRGCPRSVHDIVPGSRGVVHHRVRTGGWVNHGGTGVMAWDARQIHLPREWPERNMADMQLAVWAQLERVPMWMIPHRAHWLTSLATMDPKGIFRSSQAEGHRRRNELLQRHGRERGWELFTASA